MLRLILLTALFKAVCSSPSAQVSRAHDCVGGSPAICDRFVEYKRHSTLSRKVAVVAFYFPQFHPIPENDAFWGKGFTDWLKVGSADPLFDGHYQPRQPAHLGYYDLRLVSNMKEQVALARNYGVDAFSLHFYWFNGHAVMETPLKNLFLNKDIDISYCLTWANEDWSKRWDGGTGSSEGDILLRQNYSDSELDAMLHHMIPYFRDDRYIKVDGKPVLIVYHSLAIPNVLRTVTRMRDTVRRAGFQGLHLVSAQTFGLMDPSTVHFDAAVEYPPHNYDPGTFLNDKVTRLHPRFRGKVFDYGALVQSHLDKTGPSTYRLYRTSMLKWDNTARKPLSAFVFENFSLAAFGSWNVHNMRMAIQEESPFVFINAWNEWAEGTYLEPDLVYGFGYLEAVRQAANLAAKRRVNVNSRSTALQ